MMMKMKAFYLYAILGQLSFREVRITVYTIPTNNSTMDSTMAYSTNRHHNANFKHNNMPHTFPRSWPLFLVAVAFSSGTVDAFLAHHSMCPSMMGVSSPIHQLSAPRLSTVEDNIPLDVVSASDIVSSEGVHNMLAENSSEVGPDGVMPFAPMMSFQKYLTMQVCACLYCQSWSDDGFIYLFMYLYIVVSLLFCICSFGKD